jgi:signal transduction histidine kinase
MIAEAVAPETVTARRLHISLNAVLTFLGVIFLYWVGLAADNSPDSTFVAQSVWNAAAVQFAGGVMLLAGLASSIVNTNRVISFLATGIGLTWLAPEVAGWVDGAHWIRSAALPLSVMFVPLLIHIGLVYPIGRAMNRLDRRLVALAYAAGITVTLAVALLYEPFLDRHCWRTCSGSPYVLVDDPGLSRSIMQVSMWTAIGLSMALMWRASARGFSKSSRRGGVFRWLLGPIVVLALTELVQSLLMLARQPVDPSDLGLSGLALAKGILLTLVGFAMVWDIVHQVRRRRSLANLVSELEAGSSGPLASVLANSLSDPSIEVAYWIPSLQRHVDSEGRTVVPMSGPGRAMATLERSGVELGRVIHGSLLNSAELEREIGSAARLAVDNERLRAELLAQANEIRASQERIVAAGDTARRRLERDLHDGAQQSLLALSYTLRIAKTEAQRAEADQWASTLTGALGDVLTTIDEVRRLAHGIFPSILVDAGLVRALETLREESGVQLEIELSDQDCGEPTAMAVYQLVAAVVDAQGTDEDAQISVFGQEIGGHLVVDVVRETPVAASALVHAVDRIGAVGGTVTFTKTGMHLELPCG